MSRLSFAAALFTSLLGCTGKDPGAEAGDDTGSVGAAEGLAVLGNGSHSMDQVQLDEVANADDDLDIPRDVAFHPDFPGQLWVLNRGGPSVTIIDAVATDDRDAWLAMGASQDCGAHFMAEPSALAFGDNGMLATSHETAEVTPCTGNAPPTFMGPTLWTSNPDRFNADWASHYDMLHNSPSAVGIAWESENVYWVFDGYHQALARYDFGRDHGGGGEDHSDGILRRYVEGEVGYVPDVVSHMVFDSGSGMLYVADTGNGRIAMLDSSTGTESSRISPNYDGDDQRSMEGADLQTLVTGADFGLERPAGLAMAGDLLYVVDNATGRIAAFDLSGEVVDWLDTGIDGGALMGIAVADDGSIFVADAVNNRVLRISQASAGR